MNAETLYCQELSSFTGNQLDEFTLKKPAGWLPDTTTRAAFASSFVRTYVPTEIELNGFQGQPYGEDNGEPGQYCCEGHVRRGFNKRAAQWHMTAPLGCASGAG